MGIGNVLAPTLETVGEPWVGQELSDACAVGRRRWLLVRREAGDPNEPAYCLVYGPTES